MNLLQMSFSGAVMILAVIVIRTLAINLLPKRTFLILWGIVVLRLLIPFSIPYELSVYSLISNRATAADPTKDVVVILPIEIKEQMAVMSGNISNTASPISVWKIIWIAGVLICALVFAILYLKCRKEFQTSMPIDNDFVKSWLNTHRLKRSIYILQSSRFSAPLTYGVFRPVILMPTSTEWENTNSLRYVLEHEYVHIRRFDSITKLLLIAVLCVHWFNPLVWVMYILFNRDIELACDESVVRQFGETSKKDYSLMLISMEAKKSGLLPFCNNFSKNAIEERITAIMKFKKTTIFSLALACFIVLGAATVFATSAQADNATSSLEEQDRLLNAESNVDDVTLMSYVNPDDGRTYYSWDNGQTFEPLTDEEYEQRFPTFDVEWWTYDEYKAWLENEKAQLQEMVGEKAWTVGRGEFVWTQEMVDEAIAMYETILQEIKEGKMYSKSVAGDDNTVIAFATSAVASTDNREIAFTGNNANSEIYDIYEPFGLTVDVGKLYYNGKLIRCFDDQIPMENFSVRAIGYYEKSGVIDVRAIRKNGNNTSELIGLEVLPQVEFQNRVIVDPAESISKAATGMFDIYAEYGLRYDESQNALFYDGKRVRLFWDSRSAYSQPVDSENSFINNVSNWDVDGIIDLYTVRDYEQTDENGYGKLNNLRIATQEEFDSNTKKLCE